MFVNVEGVSPVAIAHRVSGILSPKDGCKIGEFKRGIRGGKWALNLIL